MQGPWQNSSVLLRPYGPANPLAVGSDEENFILSEEFAITSRLAISVAILAEVTGVTDIIAKLQTAYQRDTDGNWLWIDTSTITSSMADGGGDVNSTVLRGALGDAALPQTFPLGLVGRIVVTTSSSDELLVQQIDVSQPSR